MSMTSTSEVVSLRVEGVVKLTYPLRQLRKQQQQQAAETDDFTMGGGPCGAVAQQVLTLKLATPSALKSSSFESRVVYLYDAWAERLQFLKRQYKVRFEGLGLVTTLWDVGGEDTEDRQPCFVVAERDLLQQALKHQPSAFDLPRGLSIAATYEEPQSMAESDQVHYLATSTVYSRNLRAGEGHGVVPEYDDVTCGCSHPLAKAACGKRTLEQAAPTYVYTRLGDLICGKAHVYGVVVNMSLPKPTKGHDLSMTVDVVDESRPERRQAVQIVIFFRTVKLMPKVLYVGDVIRFHRLEIKLYQGDLQGTSRSKITRYLVIREDALTGELQQSTCSDSWTFLEADAERVRELLNWSKQSIRDDTSFLSGYPQPPTLLSDTVFVGAYLDIVVRVLHVSASESGRTWLVVWDGSGKATPPTESSCAATLQANSVDVPAHGVLREIVFVSCWELLQTYGFTEELLLRHWCRFRNLLVADEDESSRVASGVASTTVLRFLEGSSVLFTAESIQDVRDRLELAASASLLSSAQMHEDEEREEVVEAAAPQRIEARTVVPEFIRRDVPVTALWDVVRSKAVPRKFHCLARFVRFWPSDVAKLTKPQPGTNAAPFVYSFVVRLEDATDSIDAIVYGKDAEHFLHGIPPCDLGTSSSSRAVLEKRLVALLDSQQPHHCCVKSYSPPPASSSSSSGKAPSVRYRLFDTLLQ